LASHTVGGRKQIAAREELAITICVCQQSIALSAASSFALRWFILILALHLLLEE
jgi:hypothetical protein